MKYFYAFKHYILNLSNDPTSPPSTKEPHNWSLSPYSGLSNIDPLTHRVCFYPCSQTLIRLGWKWLTVINTSLLSYGIKVLWQRGPVFKTLIPALGDQRFGSRSGSCLEGSGGEVRKGSETVRRRHNRYVAHRLLGLRRRRDYGNTSKVWLQWGWFTQ